MVFCNHSMLELLPQRRTTVRCRYCHLTLAPEELTEGFCPECFESSGSKRYEFEELTAPDAAVARYRCEECGAIIKSV